MRVLGQPILCESSLRGQRVDVRGGLGDPSSVLILRDGERLQRALLQPSNVPPETMPTEERTESTVANLPLIRRDYDVKLSAHVRPLAYAHLTAEPGFDVERLLSVAFGLDGLAPGPAERRQFPDFGESFGPLAEDLVRIAMGHAVRMQGREELRGREPVMASIRGGGGWATARACPTGLPSLA